MPQIPITQRPDLNPVNPIGQFVNGSAFQAMPISAREYISPGDGVAALGRGIANVLDAGADFSRKSQAATDYLAEQEANRFARTQLDEFGKDLETRTDYENFDRDYKEKIKSVGEGYQVFMEKVSPQHKEIMKQKLLDISENGRVGVHAISNQRKVTNDRESNNAIVQDYIDRGDTGGAKAAVSNGIKLGLYHPAEQETWNRHIESTATFLGIQKTIDAGTDPDMADKIVARDGKGEFVNFKNANGTSAISIQNRHLLENYAKDKYSEYANTVRSEMTDKLNSGELMQSDIDASKLKLKDKNWFNSALKKQNQEWLKTELADMSAEDKLRAEDEKTAVKFNVDTAKLKLCEQEWSDDPGERANEIKTWQDKIYGMNLDPGETRELLKTIDSEVRDNKAYQEDPVYGQGKKYITEAYNKGIKLQGYWTKKKLISDPDGFGNKQSSKEFQAARFSDLTRWWNSTYKNNPGMKPEEATRLIQNEVRKIYEGTVKSYLSNAFAPGVKSTLPPARGNNDTGK